MARGPRRSIPGPTGFQGWSRAPAPGTTPAPSASAAQDAGHHHVFAGDFLSVEDGGALLYAGTSASTITVSRLEMNGGSIAHAGSGTFALAGGIHVAAGATATVEVTDGDLSMAVSAPIGGEGSLRKIGAGSLALSGANTFTGLVTLGAGSLRLCGGDERLSAGSVVRFSGNATLHLDGVSQALGAVSVSNGMKGAITGSGGSLALAGAFSLSPAAAGATLDMAGLSAFSCSAPASAFTIAPTTADAITGTVRLAQSSSITAGALYVGTDGAGSVAFGNHGVLSLGSSTTIRAGTILVGANRSRGTLNVQAGLSDPEVTLRGTDGISRVSTLSVGQINSGGQANTRTCTLNVTAARLNAMVATLNVGYNTRGGSISTPIAARFLMGGGTLDATTVYVARDATNTSGSVPISGELHLREGTARVRTLVIASG